MLLGCEEEITQPNPDLSGPGFYPLAIGNFWIYDVERIEIKALENDTAIFQLREVITDTIVSALGDITYLLNRETRETENDPWSADSLWTVRNTGQSLVVTENNVPFVKLVFPVVEGQTWDGNTFNNKGNKSYRFDPVVSSDLPEEFQGSSDSIRFIKTTISDITSAIVGTDRRFEIYADGIGLIEKDYFSISLCTADCDQVGDTLGGLVLSQQLLEFGTL